MKKREKIHEPRPAARTKREPEVIVLHTRRRHTRPGAEMGDSFARDPLASDGKVRA